MSKTIIFFGTDSFSAPALRALIAADYSIAAVITKPDSKQGRGQQLTAPLVKTIAEERSIPVWQPSKLSEIIDDIKALGPVVGVLSSYGKIIPQSIIDLFQPGIINIHPSLLPQYRGPSPIEAAIEHGDKETGVSIMLLDAEMDAGPIYTQKHYALEGNETQPQLTDALSLEGSALLVEILPAILSGELIPQPQAGEPTYCQLLTKEDGLPDPSALTAVELERRIRAHLVFPKTKVTVSGHAVVVTKSHAVDSTESVLDIACKDGSYLHIDELIGPSGRVMDGKSFLNGYAAGA